MKKFSFSWQIAILLFIIASSCQKPDIVNNIETNVSNSTTDAVEMTIVFNGVRIRKPAGVPLKIFQLNSNREVSQYLDDLNNNSSARAQSKIPLGILNSTVGSIISKYINVNKPIFEQDDLGKIYKDLPDFKSKEDIMKNAELILQYYNRLVINDLKKEVLTIPSDVSGGRYPFSNFGNGNDYERQLFNEEPIMGNCVYNASLDARDWTNQMYNSIDADDWRGNAFKHACWNAQAARKIVITGYSQWTAYEWTKRFATAHEYNTTVSPWQLGSDHKNIMDYHNNLKGRSYTKDHIRTNIWGNVVGWPSESSIINDHYNHVNNPNDLKVPPQSFSDQDKGNYILTLTSSTGTVEGLSNANYTDYLYLAALMFDPLP
ncbi:hypothetical protein G8759_23025 [Spirosoma aureum]|jgi:hypothetical protein|uniref:DUF6973 domain-containing protein n=1 Tax=Spirosoma aureum TaxID=2692134 RepID=A0A6G9ASV5_9BACT|nr:hypothetical protein [Spirosoma aureum]QIP15293.1 hypothetical protein G8759_23025 [Spirosoma aureum]